VTFTGASVTLGKVTTAIDGSSGQAVAINLTSGGVTEATPSGLSDSLVRGAGTGIQTSSFTVRYNASVSLLPQFPFWFSWRQPDQQASAPTAMAAATSQPAVPPAAAVVAQATAPSTAPAQPAVPLSPLLFRPSDAGPPARPPSARPADGGGGSPEVGTAALAAAAASGERPAAGSLRGAVPLFAGPVAGAAAPGDTTATDALRPSALDAYFLRAPGAPAGQPGAAGAALPPSSGGGATGEAAALALPLAVGGTWGLAGAETEEHGRRPALR